MPKIIECFVFDGSYSLKSPNMAPKIVPKPIPPGTVNTIINANPVPTPPSPWSATKIHHHAMGMITPRNPPSRNPIRMHLNTFWFLTKTERSQDKKIQTALSSASLRLFEKLFSLFPFDCCRGFAANIVHHAIDPFYFVDDASRNTG